MNSEDITKLNQIAENTRQNAKRLDKLINKFRRIEMSDSEAVRRRNENE